MLETTSKSAVFIASGNPQLTKMVGETLYPRGFTKIYSVATPEDIINTINEPIQISNTRTASAPRRARSTQWRNCSARSALFTMIW